MLFLSRQLSSIIGLFVTLVSMHAIELVIGQPMYGQMFCILLASAQRFWHAAFFIVAWAFPSLTLISKSSASSSSRVMRVGRSSMRVSVSKS